MFDTLFKYIILVLITSNSKGFIMKKLLSSAVFCALFVAFGLMSACNTVQGIGKDVAKGGKDIQRAAS